MDSSSSQLQLFVSSSSSLLERIQHQLEVDCNKFTNKMMQDFECYRQFPFTISHERVFKALQLPRCKEILCSCDSIKAVELSKSQCSAAEFRELTLERRMEIASYNICEFERTVDRELNSLLHLVNSFCLLDSRIQKVLKLLLWLFGHHTRQCAFEKQREVALKLYNPFIDGERIPLWPLKEEKFILWAVCSLQLQVLFGDYPGVDLLSSAIGLLNEHLRSQGLLLPEGHLLCISILEEQALYAEALDFLSSLGEDNVDRLCIKGRLLARRQDYASAAEAFQAVLVECPDDWGCFIKYLNCLLEVDNMWHGGPNHDLVHLPQLVDRKLSKLSGQEFELSMSKASDFIEGLNVVADGNISFRDLASMEIESRRILQLRSNGDTLITDLANYFSRFGHLASFTSIIIFFIENLTPSKVQQLVECLENISQESQDGRNDFKILLRTISLLKVQEGRMFRFDCNEILESVEVFCLTISRIYLESLQQFSFRQSLGLLSDSDNINGTVLTGELPSMACNILVQLFWRTQKIGFLLEAILVLEFGLVMQRSNPHYTIQLIHLYSHAGALKLAHERYTTLNIRGILMETMSHNILPQMLTSPLSADALKLLEEYEAFMEYHLGEIADLTLRGYCYRDFPNVVEGVKFRKLLQHSHNRVMARVEIPILRLKREANDFGQLEERHQEHWEGKVKEISKRRSMIIHLVRFSVCRGLYLKANSRDGTNDFSILLMEYAFSILHGGIGDDRLKKRSIRKLWRCIKRVCEGKMRFKWPISDVIDWINFAVFLNAWTSGPLDPVHYRIFSPDEPPSGWEEVNILMGSFTEAIIRDMQPLIGSPGNGHDFGLLVQLVMESLAWHVFVIRSFYQAVIPPPAARKDPEFVSEVHLLPVSYDLLGAIKSLCATLSLVTKCLGGFISRSNALGVKQCQAEVTYLAHGPGRVYELLKKQEVGELWTPESADATFTRLIGKQKESWCHLQGMCIAQRKILLGMRNDLQKLI